MRTLQLSFPVIAPGGRECILSARFSEHDLGEFDEWPDGLALPALITCNGREFEPTEDGAYRACAGGPVLRARDARFRWPMLQRMAELALGEPAH
jgi:hypothetical protein